MTSLGDKLWQQTESTGVTQKNIQLELMEIRKNQDDLEGVQFTEGAQMTQLSNRALGMNTLLSHIEWVFLVIIAFVVMNMILLGTHRLDKVS